MKNKLLLFLSTLFLFASAASVADGVVSNVVKAPITPDGNVAGAPTDFVVDLDRDLDPDIPGFALPQGCEVRVTLPDDFVWTTLPVQTVFTTSPVACLPTAFPCTTGIFLQGWPQHPIFPVFPPGQPAPAEYQLTQDPGNDNTLVFTALQDLGAPNGAALPGPGLKQIHVINGFYNPTRPGFYPIEVEFGGDGDCPTYSGVEPIHIIPKIRPSVHVTSVLGGPGNPNTIYQDATANDDAPLPWQLLLWDRDGMPMLDVTVEMVNPGRALLKQYDSAVGHIAIDAPSGATGQSVRVDDALMPPQSVAFNAPVKGIPTARLPVRFKAGSASGRYTIVVSLVGGNSMSFFVDVP